MTSRLMLAMAVASALFALPLHAAQPLQAARGTDQVAPRVERAPMPDATVERAPVRFAWALDPTRALSAPAPFVALSRSYWDTVDAATLQRGLELPLTAPDAVIQVSPVQGARALEVEQLQVRDPSGALALDKVVDAQQLRAAGMGVGEGSAMARTGASTAVGTYRLQAPQAQGRYVVQVLEPNSPIALTLQADRQRMPPGARCGCRCRSARRVVTRHAAHCTPPGPTAGCTRWRRRIARRGSMRPVPANCCWRSTRWRYRVATAPRSNCVTCSCRTRAGWPRSKAAQ